MESRHRGHWLEDQGHLGGCGALCTHVRCKVTSVGRCFLLALIQIQTAEYPGSGWSYTHTHLTVSPGTVAREVG